MQSPKLETKRIFLIASEDESLIAFCRAAIEKQISSPTIFTAADGVEALFKIDNVLPHVAIVDGRISKFVGFEVTDRILAVTGDHTVSVILVTEIPKAERYVDEVATRQVQFLPEYIDETQDQEVLFHQGEEAAHIFYVKIGQLEFSQTRAGRESVVVGYVNKDEFVGEMAHFSGEPRSATVKAVSDRELIAIPCSALDVVLFSKPVWAKALIGILARRLNKPMPA